MARLSGMCACRGFRAERGDSFLSPQLQRQSIERLCAREGMPSANSMVLSADPRLYVGCPELTTTEALQPRAQQDSN